MPEGQAGTGGKVSGYTEIRNGLCEKCHIPMDVICGDCHASMEKVDGKYHCPECGGSEDVYHCPTCGGRKGELLVAFNSLEAGDHRGNEYNRERINYCMANRNKDIPAYLRTGGKLPRFKNKKGEAERLKELNLKEGNNGRIDSS